MLWLHLTHWMLQGCRNGLNDRRGVSKRIVHWRFHDSWTAIGQGYNCDSDLLYKVRPCHGSRCFCSFGREFFGNCKFPIRQVQFFLALLPGTLLLWCIACHSLIATALHANCKENMDARKKRGSIDYLSANFWNFGRSLTSRKPELERTYLV